MTPRSATSDVDPGVASANAVLRKIDVIDSDADEAALIGRITRAHRPTVVSFVNQNVLNLSWRSADFASCLIDSDVLLRDGIGIEVCLRILGRDAGRNMSGTDFIPRLAAACAGRRTALFGTQEPWTSRAATGLAALGCRIVATMDGFRPASDYVTETTRTGPEFIILAMGNPKQEIIAREIASSTVDPVVIVNGGAIADFLGQRFERAPLWMRRAGCEWFFRLLLEPRRLWRRYLLGGASFVWYVMRLRMAL